MGLTALMFDYAPQRWDESPRTPTDHWRGRLYNVVCVPILREKKLKRLVFILLLRPSIHLHSRAGIEKNVKKAQAVWFIQGLSPLLFLFFSINLASAENLFSMGRNKACTG